MPDTSFDTVKVASIFPLERRFQKFQFRPQNTWVTPAVKKGSPPALITFGPSTETVFRGGATATDPGIHTNEHWSGFQIASDFVTTACKFNIGMKDGGSPGIWIVGHADTQLARDIKALNDELEILERDQRDYDRQHELRSQIGGMEARRWDAEVEEMTRRQTIFFDIWANWGVQLAVTSPNDIIDMHRIGADWVGMKGFSWQKEPGKETLKNCLYCFEWINIKAVICSHCTKVVDPIRFAKMQSEEADAVRQHTPHPAADNMKTKAQPKAEPVTA